MSFYDRIRHRSAASVAEMPAKGTLQDIEGRNYCVLVTYKRSGEPVPTPVWFGVGDGRFYTRTEADSWKVKRIRRNQRVRVAPSTMRGRPLGPPFEGVARVLEPAEFERAERAVAANYGIDRRLYMRFFGERPDNAAYIEVEPAGS
jgi:PPOX class probable F420-dependent enzyme